MGGDEPSLDISAPSFEYLNRVISNNGVCRTAPATPGLLMKGKKIFGNLGATDI